MKREALLALLTAIAITTGCGEDESSPPPESAEPEASAPANVPSSVGGDEAAAIIEARKSGELVARVTKVVEAAWAKGDRCNSVQVYSTPDEIDALRDAGDPFVTDPTGAVGVAGAYAPEDEAACLKLAEAALRQALPDGP